MPDTPISGISVGGLTSNEGDTMASPHKICCQHCYIAYDICDGKECPHDVHPNLSAYVGFCERYCTHPKASRADQFLRKEILMDTDLGTFCGIQFTEFFGGKDRGRCIQLTSIRIPRGDIGSIQLTKEQAAYVSEMLSEWAGKIVETSEARELATKVRASTNCQE